MLESKDASKSNAQNLRLRNISAAEPFGRVQPHAELSLTRTLKAQPGEAKETSSPHQSKSHRARRFDRALFADTQNLSRPRKSRTHRKPIKLP
jgi:hypothetical protein